MWIAFFLSHSDRQVVSSIFPLLKSELPLSDTQLGLTGSIFLWVYAFCSPIAGQIGDRFPKRALVVISLLLWSGTTILTGLSFSAPMLLACRGLMGVTESLFVPAAFPLIASLHRPETRSRAIALFSTAQLAGVVMGGWYGGFIAQHFHWRLAFYLLGLFGIAYAIPYLLFLKKVNEGVRVETHQSGAGPPAVELVKIPSYLFLCLASASYVFALWLLYTWLPHFIFEKFSLNLAQAGFTATVYLQSATLVGVLLGGAIADWLFSRTKAARFWLVSAGLLLAAPCLHLIGNTDSLSWVKLAAVAFGVGGGLLMANLNVSSFDVVPANTRASAVGFLNLTGGFVSGFAALLGGMWKQSLGIERMMSYAALICFVAGILLITAIRFYFQSDFSKVH